MFPAGTREHAVAMLAAGITTARDLGAGQWEELELRDRIAAGELPGRCAPVSRQRRPAGHCHFWGGVVKDDDQIANVIARQ